MKNFWKKLIAGVSAVALTVGAAQALYVTMDGITLGTTTAPALTACGTSPTIVGTDLAGTVTLGTGTPTGCVITFNTAKSVAPACIVTSQTAPATTTPAYTISTTAITWVQAAVSSNKINYVCAGT